ncbi:MAG: CHAT domain-containing protein [Terriglobales bacterium]
MASSAAAPDLRLLLDTEAYQAYLAGHGAPDREYFAGLAEALAQAGRLEASAPGALGPAAALLLERARASGVMEYIALAERACGNLAFLASDYGPAVEHYRAALAGLGAHEDIERGRTFSSLLHPLVMLGKVEESLAAAAAARACFERAGDQHRLARLDINLASVWFRQDQFAQALAVIERAQEGLEAGGGESDDHEAWAAIRVTRAVVLINLARFEEAEQAFEEARAYAVAHALPALAAQADYNIGYLYFLRGHWVKAIRALDRARETAAASQDKLHLALCDLDQADVCIELHLYEDALQLAHAAWTQFQAQAMPYEQGKALTNMAVAEQYLGHGGAALELLERAESAFQAANNHFWVHLTQLYRGVVLLALGRYFEALRLGERARAFFTQSGAATKAIYAELLLVQAQLRTGERGSAETMLGRARAALAGLYAPWLQTQALLLAGQLAQARGDREAALAAYEQATRHVEVTGGRINFDELRIPLLRDKSEIYERYVALLMTPPEAPAEQVWRQMERARSRALAQVVVGGIGSQQTWGEGSRVVHEINRLREELNWYYRRLSTDEPEGTGARAVDTVLRGIEQREQQLLRAIRALPGEQYRLLEGEAEVKFAQLAPLLREATLVEYFPLGERMAAVVGDARGLRALALPGKRSAIEGALRLFRYQVRQRAMEEEKTGRHAPALRHAAESHLRLLHQLLLAPLEEWLQRETLVIVPHGMLHALPFSALEDGRGALVERQRLVFVPSVAQLLQACKRARGPLRGRLAVASRPERAREQLQFWRECGAEVLEGETATIAAFRQYAPASAVLCMAASGGGDDGRAGDAGLEMADGRLNVIDIHNLGLQAQRVVLTGYGTTLGDVSRGEERIGLPRALLYAGARNVVSTLWDLGDHATTEFLRCFEQRADMGVAEGLRQAQLEIRRRYAHPYYWAAFKAHGALD